jgi:hypothetical protein
MVDRGREVPWAFLAGYVLLAAAATLLLAVTIVAIFVWDATGATAAAAREPTAVAVLALHAGLGVAALRFGRRWALLAAVPLLTLAVPVALVARGGHQASSPAISRASARSRGVSMSNERSDGIT